jgi:hypothetical protein
MIKRSLIAAAVALAVSAMAWSPAQAYYCPKNGKAIDAALAKGGVNSATTAKVKALRDKGMAQHSGGDHTAAVKSLAEAMRLLVK